MTENKNIYPTIWGSKIWASIDYYIAVLPDELYKKQIDDIMSFFNSLTSLLPCSSCKLSYIQFSKETDTNIYDINNFKTRNNIILLVFKLRNKVNKKLDVEYFIPLNYYILKLNLLICDDDNLLSSVISNLKDAPFIQEKILDPVLLYLKKKTNYDINKTKKLISTLKNFLSNIQKNDVDLKNDLFKLLLKRNKKCQKYRDIINKNRILYDYNYEQSFSNDFDFHMKLFSFGCNYLKTDEILHLIKN